MSKETIAIRVPDDTFERFEEYRTEGEEISKADAGRRLLEYGLKYEEGELVMPAGSGDTRDKDGQDADSDQQGSGFVDTFLPVLTGGFVVLAVGALLFGAGGAALLSSGFALGGFATAFKDGPELEWLSNRLQNVLMLDPIGPEEPTTIVEWLAALNDPAYRLFLAGVPYAILARAAPALGLDVLLTATLGPTATRLLIFVLPVVWVGATGLFQLVSVFALAIVRRGEPDPVHTPAEVPTDA